MLLSRESNNAMYEKGSYCIEEGRWNGLPSETFSMSDADLRCFVDVHHVYGTLCSMFISHYVLTYHII